MESNISICALITSGFATIFTIISCWITYRSLHSSAKPILVFVYVQMENQARWMIENVGSGTALEITVYESDDSGKWDKGKKIIPIPAGTRVECPFTYHCPKLGASYVSILDKKYHSTCVNYETKFNQGSPPKGWLSISVDSQKELKTRYPIIG